MLSLHALQRRFASISFITNHQSTINNQQSHALPHSPSNSPPAVITGAGGTLCSVMALELARKGHPVALLGRTLSKLESVATLIRREGGTALCIALDVTDISAVRAVGEQVLAVLGPCRILINGAVGKLPGGVMTQTEYSPEELNEDSDALGFLNCDLEVFRGEVDLNLSGTAIPSQVIGRHMAAAGGGSIVNFASMTSFRPLTKVPAYAAAKAAIVNYTQWLTDDSASGFVTGITVPVDGGFLSCPGTSPTVWATCISAELG